MSYKGKISKRGKFERLDASFIVNFTLEYKRGETHTAMCENVGGRGLRFTFNEKLRISSILELELCIPDSQSPIRARGMVVWAKKKPYITSSNPQFDIGIEFVLINFYDRDRIHKFIYSHAYRKNK